ncbi:hypothetical protein [Anaeromicropila herbilytica]|uniref:Uncharacterized protein n=1 Tax=Anaeromicropila herbilytica TaxID=2785025 RepID=A0A7R7IBF6_9FIRM|nr:hypothetical protein [Anaeromicropila herbilytica]BCN29557.1 hypothetical protein bsdtb5_08520 [Anaeromicropila herbilytica]
MINYIYKTLTILIGFTLFLISGFNLITANKTETIFYNAKKRVLSNILSALVMVLSEVCFIYNVPLINNIKIDLNSYKVVLLLMVVLFFILIVSIFVILSIQNMKKVRLNKILNRITRFFYDKSIQALIMLIFYLFGSVIMIVLWNINGRDYMKNLHYLIFAVGYSCATVYVMMIYVEGYRKIFRNVCWIEYKEYNSIKSKKYYILYASDDDYVVCGQNHRYEDNVEFKFIKINEIKDNYIIHFEKITE